ncbi:Hypothetical protein LCA_0724 [Latilactobacillus sakei subsp. sakei 23K]|uniref:HEPN AbiJ-N-terminal domain-containing protein n=1 Tax=Latilactobacillus sakei subsp. sakei (strain 23K) TaxID=314315 RepID=Q38XQ1_LATSS|nr:hypothetical protein [Latilactobacillus sakei]CAI55028.1 Hypothetical protein LCA_0724 [Latilactobacillus sakei subsp. sakei 23K]
MKFSERMGYTQPLPFQTDSMSEGLKNDIINLYCQIYQIKCDEANDFYNLDADKFNNDIWEKFFHNISGYTDIKIIIAQVKKLEWFEIYDFLEYVCSYINDDDVYNASNLLLKNQNSGFRFVDHILIPISDETDMKNVENAINSNFDNGHIKIATQKLSEKNPDYPKIIGESIDGVEIAIKNVVSNLYDDTPTNKFGGNIKILKKHNFLDGHPAYIEILNKLYGYASDGGIRHPKDRDYKITEADAVFAVEICSAFVSFLKYKVSSL